MFSVSTLVLFEFMPISSSVFVYTTQVMTTTRRVDSAFVFEITMGWDFLLFLCSTRAYDVCFFLSFMGRGSRGSVAHCMLSEHAD